jgi:hypothetical protein
MHGDLLCVGLRGDLWWIGISDDGRGATHQTNLASDLVEPLDVAVAANGTIYVADRGQVAYFKPTWGYVAGDADCDGAADSVDAALVLQSDAGLLASVPCHEPADVNNDAAVDSLDAALILQCVAGLVDCADLEP